MGTIVKKRKGRIPNPDRSKVRNNARVVYFNDAEAEQAERAAEAEGLYLSEYIRRKLGLEGGKP